MPDTQAPATTGLEIAIIGMAGRFPGAPDVESFWRNIRDGVESIARLDPDDLRARGVPDDLLDAPDFVAAGAPLHGSDTFDAEFFGYSPAEAELLDPQQRIFLECAWHALEDAAYAPRAYPGAIGVYAAAGMNGYLLNLYGNARLREAVTPYEIFTANDKDFLATRAAYKLNLRGPAVTVQTACSSSLVAVHMAAQSLIAGECDMALAGGVALSRQDGYRALQGSILSPTGQCRAFDAGADGTVAGNGVGLVVLKRLEDALADGDHVEAVIRGSAVNNDGAGKASFTAPDVAAQADVIAAAHAAAEVAPDTISYVEAHGTGTALGDPVEVTALTRAFRRGTERTGFCALGSVKTNIGHLDTAAGIAGLIKTVLMLRHRTLAPSLHFANPNPRIDFATSPFAVTAECRDWTCDGPRRAGVSSFGIGGTNAHVVLEEAPSTRPQDLLKPFHAVSAKAFSEHDQELAELLKFEQPAADAPPQLLVLSARSAPALAAASHALADHLDRHAPPLTDVAHTLATGREPFRWRQAVVARSQSEAATRLRDLPPASQPTPADSPQPVFLFPGQGSQHPGMARGLYGTVPAFTQVLDRAAAHLGPDFLPMLFGAGDDIHRTENAQLALFVVEYGLAQVWTAMGVTPRALLGHSVGELTAACLAGIFGFEDGLDLVATRGRLMQAAQPGAMLAVIHPDRPLANLLTPSVEIAAESGPGLSTVSGPAEDIAAFETRLEAEGIGHRGLRTSHGFHSAAMDSAAADFADAVAGVTLSPPRVPMVSNLTGTWLTESEGTDPQYWGRHLRRTVRFGDGAATLLGLETPVFLELGPGTTLAALLRHQGATRTVCCLEPGSDDVDRLLAAAGAAWCAGLAPDWLALSPESRRRVSLPGYQFQRQRYWIAPDTEATPVARPGEARVYVPAWGRAGLPPARDRGRRQWLVFDDGSHGRALAEAIERSGDDAWRVATGETFAEPEYRAFTLPAAGGAADLLGTLAARGAQPTDVAFLCPLGDAGTEALARALHDLVGALAGTRRQVRLTVVTRGAADITGAEPIAADRAALHGLVQVAGQEYPWLGCRILDLDPDERAPRADVAAWLRQALLSETAPIAARRGGRHWRLHHAPQPLELPWRPRRNGVFAVIGHVAEGVGRVWADALAEIGARLALIEDPGATPFHLPDGDALMRIPADCADAAALGAALDEVAARWGRIDGVFLSTPFSDTETTAPLALLGDGQRDRARTTITAPLQALADTMPTRRIGFACVQSSLSSAIGGAGLAAYAAAHHHGDVFVAAQDRDSATDWYAIGWDAIAGDEPQTRPRQEDFALSPDQVWDATCRILGARLTGASIVSRGDVDARRTEWLNPVPQAESGEKLTGGRPRPEIETPFIAPRTPLETTVAGILQDLLGLDRIGAEDGFFELGGHSLLAIRAIARLRETFPVEIEMRELLTDNPSAAGIARLIETKLAGDTELAALLAEVSDLSEEELQTALEEGAVP